MDWFTPFVYKCSQDQQEVQQNIVTISGKYGAFCSFC